MGNVAIAFLLTLIAGLSTGIGGLIALFTKTSNKKFLSVSLGFSAGVMIYISMMEILPGAIEVLSITQGQKTGMFVAVAAFFGGMLLIAIIDRFVPSEVNPHEPSEATAIESDSCALVTGSAIAPSSESNTPEHEETKTPAGLMNINRTRLLRTGLFTAFVIALHNFPEGIATFIIALEDPIIALPIVFAIAIHNIPEGLVISVPIYCATGSKAKAILYSFAAGLTEPLGALIGYLILMPFLNDTVFGIVFALVAGIMVFISFDELLPSARAYGQHHLAVYGLLAGMAVMAISIWLFV
ncbi:MAG: zinc transporter ZupT [Coriobacteriia bacterium]|nr:zinc transporter ZupT [Coriobacteriia bacterium]